MAKAAYVTVRGDKLIVETPYDEDFVRQLKEASTSRRWDPDAKVWEVGLAEKPVVEKLVKRHFGRRAYLIEGAAVTNLHTGECVEQMEMF